MTDAEPQAKRPQGRPRQERCLNGHLIRGPGALVYVNRHGYPCCRLCRTEHQRAYVRRAIEKGRGAEHDRHTD